MRITPFFALATALYAETINVDWKIEKSYEVMQNIVASPGDVLRFNWEENAIGPHNVFILKKCDGNGKQKWNKFKCPKKYNAKTGNLLGEVTGVEYTVPEDAPDSLCFVCTLGGHCKAGQHSTVTVYRPPPALEVRWRWGMTSNENTLVAVPGQEIVFKYNGGHNLRLSKTCNGGAFQDPPTSFQCRAESDWLQGSGPASWFVPDDAEVGSFFCFYCSFGSHCSSGGQHLTVKVKSSDPLDALKSKCTASTPAKQCKFCGGKSKNGKCKISAKKLGKFKCSKVKNDTEFCGEVGCTVNGNKCTGKPGSR